MMEDKENLQCIVIKLKEACPAAGLTMNVAKHQFLIVGSERVNDLKQQCGGMQETKYLGMISSKKELTRMKFNKETKNE